MSVASPAIWAGNPPTADTAKEVARRVGVDIVNHFRYGVDYDQMPEEAWALIDRGLTLGLFQIEQGAGAKRLAKQIKPRSIEDLAVLVALNRPGPLRSGDADRYVKRRQGTEDVTYPHSILSVILEPTLGVFVYQEQVIAYFSAIGYSLSDADHIRKIMGKKLVSEMSAEMPKYMAAAEQHMPRATAEHIWRLIVSYSMYGFNKAHAVGYAMILAWAIYAKWRWPTEFVMALIETNPKLVGAYIGEARRMDIAVLPPDINRSHEHISKHDGAILYGLSDIKGVKSKARDVVALQPYASPEEFVQRCPVDRGTRDLLIRAGALDSFGYRLSECPACGGRGKVPQMVPKVRGEGLKRVLAECGCVDGLTRVDLPTPQERVDTEEELLGIALTDLHSELIEQFQERIDKLDKIVAADTDEEGTVKVPGIITEVKKTRVRANAQRNANAEMAHVRIAWLGEEVRFVAFPDTWERFNYMLKPRVLGEFTIKTGPKGPQLLKGYRYIH